MAISPTVQLAPNVIAPDASYPLGSSKNETAPGNNDGTPYNKIRADDILGMQQALLKIAGIVASGNADTALDKTSSQYAQAMLHMVLGANTFDETGAADAYILDVVGDNPAPANYSSNMNVVFVPGNTNTGASVINVEGLGAQSIRLNGVALVGGEIVAGVRTTLIYDIVNGWFELLFETGKLVQEKNFQTGAVATGATVLLNDDTIPTNAEGDEYMQLSITPKATTNILIIDVVFNGSVSSSLSEFSGALFQDATVNAIASGFGELAHSSNEIGRVVFRHIMLAGTVIATTFKLRVGPGSASTITFNGRGGTRRFGGVMASSMSIREVSP